LRPATSKRNTASTPIRAFQTVAIDDVAQAVMGDRASSTLASQHQVMITPAPLRARSVLDLPRDRIDAA
jgi:hypothetical protein